MIIIRLMGGLGNQMFQYAFGRRMSIINNTELVLDDTLLLDRSLPNELVTHRNFELDIFKLCNYRWATNQEVFGFNGDPSAPIQRKIVRKLKNIIYPKKLIIQKFNEINPKYFLVKGNTCFVGRWQSVFYFNDVAEQIKQDFQINMALSDMVYDLQNKINSCNAVCIHIRRGDLVTSSIYSNTIGTVSLNYYNEAIEYMKKHIVRPVFFVFSDDIDWCKENISRSKDFIFIEKVIAGEKAEGHFFLMQQCKHFIISNSTFAWWAAWLATSENKFVIYPKDWYKDLNYKNPKMCPKDWLSF